MKEVLITSSVLIAVILLARWLFRGKVSQRLIYAAWLLVAVRLLVPVQFGQSQYSITTLTEKIETQSKPIQQIQEVLQKPVIGPSQAELYQQILDQYLEQNSDSTGLDAPEQVAPNVQQQIETQVEEQRTAPTLAEVLCAIWIVGISGMGTWFLTANLIFLHRAKKDSVPFTDCKSKVSVRISPNVPTPCLVGFFRPVIYLTPACAENEQTRSHVLTHELTHLGHFDHIWAMVRCVCLCVYWFNPLVWIAAGQSRRDCELACDESALKKLGDDERIAYGKTLLATVTQSVSPVHLIETPTSMNETKRQLKERIQYIAKKPKNILIAAICMVLIAVLTIGCTFTGAKITGGFSRYLPMEATRYDSTGIPYDQHIYAYDEQGRMIRDQYICPAEESYRAYTRTYTYNNQGYLASKTNNHLDPSDPDYRHTYIYDYNDSGMVASCRWISGAGNKVYHYSYDDQGRLLTISIDADGGQYTIVTCFYNERGKLTCVQYEPPEQSMMEYAFEYDESGKLVRYLRWNYAEPNNGPLHEKITYHYDDFGNLYEINKDPGYSTPCWTFRYQDNELTDIEYRVQYYNAEDEIRDYILDRNGNVSSISCSNGSQTAYLYDTIAVSGGETDPRHLYWNVANEPLTVTDYCDRIVYFFLPRVELSNSVTDSLY